MDAPREWSAMWDGSTTSIERKGGGPKDAPDPKNGRSLTNGRGLTNGDSLTSGPGMVNGLAYTWGEADTPPLERVTGLTMVPIGASGGNRGPRSGGMILRLDLINGFSIRPEGRPPERTKGLLGRRRRRASRERVQKLARRAMPGEDHAHSQHQG